MLAGAAGKLQYNGGTLRKHFTKPLTQVAARPSTLGVGVQRWSTMWIKRIEPRKWNRWGNGLHQLGQPIATSVLLPVFNPPYPQGIFPTGTGTGTGITIC